MSLQATSVLGVKERSSVMTTILPNSTSMSGNGFDMTVEQLIKSLSQYPPDSLVLVEYSPGQCALVGDASPTNVSKEDLHSTEEMVGKPAVYFTF